MKRIIPLDYYEVTLYETWNTYKNYLVGFLTKENIVIELYCNICLMFKIKKNAIL